MCFLVMSPFSCDLINLFFAHLRLFFLLYLLPHVGVLYLCGGHKLNGIDLITRVDVLPSKNQALCEYCTLVGTLKHC